MAVARAAWVEGAGVELGSESADSVLWDSGVVDLPAPDRDVVLDFPAVDGVIRARFTSTADESDHPGLGEFEVIGFLESTNLSLDPGTTANAISIFNNSYPASRVLDARPRRPP